MLEISKLNSQLKLIASDAFFFLKRLITEEEQFYCSLVSLSYRKDIYDLFPAGNIHETFAFGSHGENPLQDYLYGCKILIEFF